MLTNFILWSEKSDGFKIPIRILMPVFHTKNIESILDPVAQQVNPFKNCIVVLWMWSFFSSSHHVSFVSCFLSIFLNIDLANLMCMGSYMTDYIKISTNLHDCSIFSNNENRWFMHSSINYAKAIMYGSIFFIIFSMNFALCKLQKKFCSSYVRAAKIGMLKFKISEKKETWQIT